MARPWNQFLEWFPGVTRERVLAVLEFARRVCDRLIPGCASSSIREYRFHCAEISRWLREFKCVNLHYDEAAKTYRCDRA